MKEIEYISSKEFQTVRKAITSRVEPQDILKAESNPLEPFNNLMTPTYINNPLIKYVGTFEERIITAFSPKALYWTRIEINLYEHPRGTRIILKMKQYWFQFGIALFFIGLGILISVSSLLDSWEPYEVVQGSVALVVGVILGSIHRFRINRTRKYFLNGL